MTAAASTMVERLAAQLQRVAATDDDLLQDSRTLAQLAAEEQTIVAKATQMNQGKEKLVALRARLTAQRGTLAEQVQQLTENDDIQRKALSEELTASITGINERVEVENVTWTAVVTDNSRLKEKLQLLRDSEAAGGSKFEELLGVRDEETGAITKRLAEVQEANVAFVERLQLLTQRVADETVRHAPLKVQADEYVAQFAVVQAKLSDANAHFTKSKVEQDRLTQRIKVLETERAESQRRMERSRKDRDEEMAAAAKATSHATTLEAQVQQLQTLTARFTQ
jgi:chromosome segregation ATPase